MTTTNGYELWKLRREPKRGTTLRQGYSHRNFWFHTHAISPRGGNFCSSPPNAKPTANELWNPTGPKGNHLARIFKTVLNGSILWNLPSGRTLFFPPMNETNGYELWSPTGTEVGTTLVKDIRTGIFGSNQRLSPR